MGEDSFTDSDRKSRTASLLFVRETPEVCFIREETDLFLSSVCFSDRIARSTDCRVDRLSGRPIDDVSQIPYFGISSIQIKRVGRNSNRRNRRSVSPISTLILLKETIDASGGDVLRRTLRSSRSSRTPRTSRIPRTPRTLPLRTVA